MKQYRSMITLLAVLVVCICLYFVLGYISDRQEEKEQEEDILVTNLVSLESLEYSDGETKMFFVKEDDVWYVADDKEFALNSVQIETIAKALIDVTAVRQLDGADGPEAYGLDDPAYTISMKDGNGKETTLYIGDATGDNYYATVDEKTVIYTIGTSAVDALEFDLTTLEVVEEEETTEETAENSSDGEDTTE